MPEKDLTFYCYQFEKLRRDYRNGGAPHKPILLISLIQAFQQGFYSTSEIKIIPELIGLFKSNWSKLVVTNHQCLFTLPFYHMRSEPFWNLKANIGCEMWVKSKSAMRSFTNLTTAVKYAVIDKELMELFLSKTDAEILLQVLLQKYFPGTKSEFNFGSNNYMTEIEKQIVEDPKEIYKKRLLQIRQKLDNDAFQEEVYLRSNIFKKEIPKIYNYTCCISGLRIDAVNNVSMIDACHIIPFSESYNDTISNGIALSPTLHRAFDRGLISIDNNYKVIVNNTFSELNRTPHNIKQFSGMRLLLPDNNKYIPSRKSLEQHRSRFNF